jgi:hypothetical protein
MLFMKISLWKKEGFLDSLTVCSYPKVAISEHITVNQAQTLIEAQSLI